MLKGRRQGLEAGGREKMWREGWDIQACGGQGEDEISRVVGIAVYQALNYS